MSHSLRRACRAAIIALVAAGIAVASGEAVAGLAWNGTPAHVTHSTRLASRAWNGPSSGGVVAGKAWNATPAGKAWN